MTAIFVLKRFVDEHGKLQGFLIQSGTETRTVSVDECKSLYADHPFINMLMQKNGIFRARMGYTIVTETVYSKKTPANVSKVIKQVLEQDVCGFEFVNLCRRLRKAINSNRLTVDTRKHSANNSANTQYFKFIQCCGYDIADFIKLYLYNMQPCTVAWKVKKTKNSDIYVIMDTGYRVNLYIKFTSDYSVIISFHDDIQNGKLQSASLRQQTQEYSYILTNVPVIKSATMHTVVLSRGFSTFRVQLWGTPCADDLIKVRTVDLVDALRAVMSNSLYSAYQMYSDRLSTRSLLDLAQSKFKLDSFAFTSYGNNILNTLSMLVDVYALTTKNAEKQEVFTLISNITGEEIFVEDKEIIRSAMQERYYQYKNPALELIFTKLS